MTGDAKAEKLRREEEIEEFLRSNGLTFGEFLSLEDDEEEALSDVPEDGW